MQYFIGFVQQSESNGKETISLEDVPRLQEMMARHCQNWFDEPIPMLDNKTPRQAAKTKKGREQLKTLFLLYECNSLEHKDNLLKTNTPFLRSELGLS